MRTAPVDQFLRGFPLEQWAIVHRSCWQVFPCRPVHRKNRLFVRSNTVAPRRGTPTTTPLPLTSITASGKSCTMMRHRHSRSISTTTHCYNANGPSIGSSSAEEDGWPTLDYLVNEENSVLYCPESISCDPNGPRLFISDTEHNRIIVCETEGRVVDVIGHGKRANFDDTFEDARFASPTGTAYDRKRDVLWIADTDNNVIKRADMETRHVSSALKYVGTTQEPLKELSSKMEEYNDILTMPIVPQRTNWWRSIRAGKLVTIPSGYRLHDARLILGPGELERADRDFSEEPQFCVGEEKWAALVQQQLVRPFEVVLLGDEVHVCDRWYSTLWKGNIETEELELVRTENSPLSQAVVDHMESTRARANDSEDSTGSYWSFYTVPEIPALFRRQKGNRGAPQDKSGATFASSLPSSETLTWINDDFVGNKRCKGFRNASSPKDARFGPNLGLGCHHKELYYIPDTYNHQIRVVNKDKGWVGSLHMSNLSRLGFPYAPWEETDTQKDERDGESGETLDQDDMSNAIQRPTGRNVDDKFEEEALLKRRYSERGCGRLVLYPLQYISDGRSSVVLNVQVPEGYALAEELQTVQKTLEGSVVDCDVISKYYHYYENNASLLKMREEFNLGLDTGDYYAEREEKEEETLTPWPETGLSVVTNIQAHRGTAQLVLDLAIHLKLENTKKNTRDGAQGIPAQYRESGLVFVDFVHLEFPFRVGNVGARVQEYEVEAHVWHE